MTGPRAIHAADIVKTFGTTPAVVGATLSVGAGELVALLGPSGSGKTTMLRTIAGFEAPDSGSVEVGGRLVAGPGVWEEPEARRVGMVFQDGALFPHLTVAANIAFGKPRAGRVEECLALVGLSDRGRAYPHELSGGERQRVALARALACEPEVILLDEPFASLDTGLRTSLREQVAVILRDAGASALLVTHDQQEALSLADRLVVMRHGAVEQEGAPEDVYANPATRWVAEFLGAADVVPGIAGGGTADSELGRFPAARELTGAVDVVVRPEAVLIDHTSRGHHPSDAARGRVMSRAFYGHDQLVRVELASGVQLRSRSAGNASWQVGDEVCVWVAGPVSVLAATPH